jgi:hypothetical protein
MYRRFDENLTCYSRSSPSRMITMSPVPARLKRARLLAPLLISSSVLALMAGCASGPESHVLSAPPPAAPNVAPATVVTSAVPMTTTTQTTQTTPTGTVVTTQTQPANTVYVNQAPPALQPELILAQPSSSHSWVAGYWTWRSNQYQWMAGHWEVPPYANAKWIAPRWQTENSAYRFYEGYWN